jgi:phosphatidylinositol kinase/protein kinase (PI-3  family)
MALQENADKVIVLVEMMVISQNDLPCFKEGAEKVIKELKTRFFPTGKVMSQGECSKFIDRLIAASYDNWRTVWYDKIQYFMQGIF